MTVNSIPCLSWRNQLVILLYFINCIYNKETKRQANSVLMINVHHRGSDFSLTSPIILGSVGVGALIIIVLMVIYYIRNKNTEVIEKKPTIKKKTEKNEEVEVNKEVEECKEVDNIENVEKPEIIEKADITIEVNNADNYNDVSNRVLIVTPIEEKEKRISVIFQDFSEKINNQTADLSQHDRDDFLKPVYVVNENNEQVPIPSEASKISKISLNQDLKKLNHNEFAFFTNERRDSPSNSFYDAKKEDTEQLADVGEEESKKQSHLNQKKNTIEPKKIEKEHEHGDEYEYEYEDEEEEEIAYKEANVSPDNNNLKPPRNDIISDFEELTKNRKIELFKKNTQELEKEEQSKINENKVSIFYKQVDNKPKDSNSYIPKRKVEEISASILENKSQKERKSKINDNFNKEEKDLKREKTIYKADKKPNNEDITKFSDINEHNKPSLKNKEKIEIKDSSSKIKDKTDINSNNEDIKIIKENKEVVPATSKLSKGK